MERIPWLFRDISEVGWSDLLEDRVLGGFDDSFSKDTGSTLALRDFGCVVRKKLAPTQIAVAVNNPAQNQASRDCMTLSFTDAWAWC